MTTNQTGVHSVHDGTGTNNTELLRFPGINWAFGVAAAVCLVGLVLLMYAGGFLSLSADEFTKAVIAWRGLHDPAFWLDFIWLPGHFPLLAAAYVIIGDLLTASRLVSVLFGIVAIIGIYRLGHHIGAEWVGGLAALLCATSPLVVWLSATGLVDILYTALFILGLSYYVQSQRSGELCSLYIACTLFAVSCAFHYNAWLAVAAVGVLIGSDLIWSRSHNRLHWFLALCIIGIVPIAWCVWNWIHYGEPLHFFHTHKLVSSKVWANWGGDPPSLKDAVYWVVRPILRHGPVLAGLTIASAAGWVIATEDRQKLLRLWLILLIFGGGLIFLYTQGGRPTAYPDRYLLLPLFIMALLSAHTLNSLARNQDRYVRVFAGLLFGIALVTNLWLTQRYQVGDATVQEAVAVADFLEKTGRMQTGDRVLLEVKKWNKAAIGVFLNDPSMIIGDLQNSVLMRSEEEVRRFAQEMEIRRIAVWSDAAHTHVKKWGLRRMGQVESYTFYELN